MLWASRYSKKVSSNYEKFQIDFFEFKLKEIYIYYKYRFYILLIDSSNQMSTLAQRNLQLLHSFITDYITNHKYTLVSNLENIKKTTDKFEYKCLCGNTQNHSKQNLKCIFDKYENWYPECCIKANLTGDYKWYFDPNIKDEYVDSQTKDIWKQYEGIWISNKGKCIGIEGDELTVNPTTTEVRTKKVMFRLPDIMAKLFKVQKYELLNEKNKYYARFGENNDLDYNIENLVILKVSEIKSKNRQHKNHTIKDDQTESPIDKNIPHKELDFCPGYTIFSDGKIWQKNTETFKGGNKWKDLSKNSAGNIILKFKKENEEHSYLVKRLVIIAFKPYNSLTKYEDYDKLEIIHLNGDINDCNVSNLFVQEPLTSEQKKKNKVKDRINELHSKIIELIKNKNGKLISNLDNIKTINDLFIYECECNTQFERNYKQLYDIKDNKCSKCLEKAKLNTNTGEQYNFTTKEGERFIKTKYCYVSDLGRFLSNDKQTFLILNEKDNCIKFNNEKYNGKHIMAKAFNIPYCEYLDNNNEFYVTYKDNEEGLKLNNIYIWAYSKANQKLLPNNQVFEDNKTKKSKSYEIVKNPNPNTRSVILEDFESVKLYDDGSIECSYTRIRVKGSLNKDGYYVYKVRGVEYKMHRLICYAFNKLEHLNSFDNYENLDVNHKDGNKQNNVYTNLEWVTKSENNKHALENGLCNYNISILQYSVNKDGTKKDFIKRFNSITDAHSETNLSKIYIKNLLEGKSKSEIYYFEYENIEKVSKLKEKQLNKKFNYNEST